VGFVGATERPVDEPASQIEAMHVGNKYSDEISELFKTRRGSS
jgi:hypothetical protein